MKKYIVILFLFLITAVVAEWSADTMKVPIIQARVADIDTLGVEGTAQMDSTQIGGGTVVVKLVKVGSHLAIILSGSDTLWAAADTTNF